MSAVPETLPQSASLELATQAPPQRGTTLNESSWALAQRQAKALASSTLVPELYRGPEGFANCLIALEMANRMGASPLLVMQNLYVVHGNPSWSAKFLIATFNQNGKFSALRYVWSEERTSCRAVAIEKATGEVLDGPTVSVEMAKAEGWSTKSGSKWKTMPELMLMYRAATFFVRTYAPELSMGLHTVDEVEDYVDMPQRSASLSAVRAALDADKPPEAEPAAEAPAVETGISEFEAVAYAIEGAGDAELAGIVLDRARSTMTGEQYDALCTLWKQKWERQ